MQIGQRKIGTGERVLVIAEIGVNHDGSLARARELVELARSGGADAVKLQIFQARTLLHGSAAFAGYQRARCRDDGPEAMLRRYELSEIDLLRLVDCIREGGMLPLATPFSLADVAVVQRLDLPCVKIASPDLVNRPLLERVARLGRPMLVSTGAASMEEVETAAVWLLQCRAEFVFMHCVSSYPVPGELAHLGWIRELMRLGVPVGYSDHTTETLGGALAVAAGAVVVEKHLTYDRQAEGPDHAASADPEQFADYVQKIRQAQRLCGPAGKRVLEVEQDVRRVSRQSVVVCRDVAAGQRLNESDLTVQRPGLGIPAARWHELLGRRVSRALPGGTMLQWDMLNDAA